jgi:tetratricopeptide (TPR) repeat protein/formylglycine-generating enzyme required for sulfatase activity
MKLTLIGAGKFLMGSPEDEPKRKSYEDIPREVTISEPFYMGVCEVTQDQWRAVMGYEPWKNRHCGKPGGEKPANWISWYGAKMFCRVLSKKTGWDVRLPSEAQWEYACRAGADMRYCFGDDKKKLLDYAWYDALNDEPIFRGRTKDDGPKKSGRKKPNAWGLHDMHGNVQEWCRRWLKNRSSRMSMDLFSDNAYEDGDRVLRGGGWDSVRSECRPAFRRFGSLEMSDERSGFRVVVSPGSKTDRSYLRLAEVPSDLTDARAWYDLGNAWRARGVCYQAIVYYNRAIGLDPDYAPAYYNRGLAWLAEDAHDQAIEDFSRAIELKPTYVAAYLKRGQAARYGSDIFWSGDALEDFKRVLELRPDSSEAYHGLGWCYLDVFSGFINGYGMEGPHCDELDKGLADYNLAIKQNPNDSKAYYLRGILLYCNTKYHKAAVDLSRYIEMTPADAAAYKIRGDVWGKLRQYDKAIADYSRAIEIDSSDYQSYYDRGRILDIKGLYDQAVSDFTRAIEIDPTSDQAYFQRGHALAAGGDRDQAAADFQRGFEADSWRSYKYRLVGEDWLWRGEYERALVYFTRAVETLDVGRVPALILRSRIWSDMGVHDKALADCNRAIELDPEYPQSFMARSDAWDAMCEYNKALSDINRAMKMDPKFDKGDGGLFPPEDDAKAVKTDAYRSRALVWDHKGEYDKSVADYKRAMELSPKSDYLYNNRALVWMHMGAFDKAVADCNRAIKNDPKDAFYYGTRGKVYAARGDCDKALVDYNRALEIYPEYFTEYRLRGLLYFNLGKFGRASGDFQSYVNLWRGDKHGVLWRYIARRRAGKSAGKGLSVFARRYVRDRSLWPGAVFDMFEGRIDPEMCIKAAGETKYKKLRPQQLCEAYFYAAQYELIQGRKDIARKYLRKCLDFKVPQTDQQTAAKAELKRMGPK